jgi:hypothetical protein
VRVLLAALTLAISCAHLQAQDSPATRAAVESNTRMQEYRQQILDEAIERFRQRQLAQDLAGVTCRVRNQ